jgi:hypothetical protein
MIRPPSVDIEPITIRVPVTHFGGKRRAVSHHKNSGRQEKSRQFHNVSGRRWRIIFIAGALVAALAIIGAAIVGIRAASAPSPTPTPVTLAARIDDIPCNAENVTFHEHAYLGILVHGKAVPVPARVGIHDDTCLYWLHTHDNSGEIHLEAPAPFPFTLGDFFDIWGAKLSRTQVLDYTVTGRSSMRIYVNFKPYAGDPRAIPLKRHTQIAVEIGPPFKSPAPFDFQGD